MPWGRKKEKRERKHATLFYRVSFSPPVAISMGYSTVQKRMKLLCLLLLLLLVVETTSKNATRGEETAANSFPFSSSSSNNCFPLRRRRKGRKRIAVSPSGA